MSGDDKATGTSQGAPSGPAVDTEKSTDSEKNSNTGKTNTDDPYGADRRAFDEAYWRGILRTDGPMQFLRDAKFKKQHIGDVFHIYGDRSRAVTSASVRAEYLARVRDRYVQVTNYESMYAVLSSRRTVVLCGQQGTGRFTSALRLLDELAAGKVSRFDDDQDIKSLSNGTFEKGRGYVIELVGEDSMALTESLLDKLRDQLVKHECYCVVITDADGLTSDALGGYAVAYEPPDKADILQRHIAEEVRADDDAGVEILLRKHAETPRLQVALGRSPRPGETAEMAKLLVQFGRKEITLEDVETQAAQLVHRQVVEWFASLASVRTDSVFKEALRRAAFRIALAVFNESPYHIVAKAGVELAERFIRTVGRDGESRPTLFGDDQARRLPESRAEIVDGQMAFGQVGIPVGLARFCDSRFPVVLLSYVWQHHHNLRGAMVAWLWKQSKDPRPMIWVRAAQATGLLCSLDFHFTYTKMIVPGAAAEGKNWWQRRLFAAVALDQAARDERITAAIQDRLKYWRRSGTDSEKWTAAAALGYDLGRRSIAMTLEELRVLGTPSELQSVMDERTGLSLVAISGYSLANLLAFGEVRPILQQLAVWIASDRQSVRELAWWALRYLVDLHGYDLGLLRRSAGRDTRALPHVRERWPLLLALQDDEPDLAEPIANLLRWQLRGRRSDVVARHLFGPWIRAAEKDAECLRALGDFIPLLVEDEVDSNRLRYLIARLRRDWCDPLQENAAILLEAAIRKGHR